MAVNDQIINDLNTGIRVAEINTQSADLLIEQADELENEAAKTAATLAKESAHEATLKFQKALGSEEKQQLNREGVDLLKRAEEYLTKAMDLLEASGEHDQ